MNSFPNRSSLLLQRVAAERGIALVMTLAILVMVTMLVVAFAISMRVENMASNNFNEMIKARQFAQGAIDMAVGTILSATTNATYATSPGAIFVRPSGGSWSTVLLYTPIRTIGVITAAGSNDLNAGNWITGTNTIYTNSRSMFVGWTNVIAISGIVTQYGRYAYWVDDESAKVNLNVSGTRSNDLAGRTLAGQTTAAIDLQALFSASKQQAITNFVASTQPFDTLDCIQQVVTNLTLHLPAISQIDEYTNQFYVTAISSSPDYTPWGTKRLNLSNVVATSSSRQAAVTNIANMLSTNSLSDWFGETFSNKYPNVYQIAANIVDYIGTTTVPTDSGSGWNDTTPPGYLGLQQTPYLNELVISNTITISTNGAVSPTEAIMMLYTTNCVELWYMYTNSTWTPANTEVLLLMNTSSFSFGGGGGVGAIPLAGILTNTTTLAANTTMTPSSFTTVSGAGSFTTAAGTPVYSFITVRIQDTNTPVTVTANLGTNTAIYRVTSGGQIGRIDYAQIPPMTSTLTLNLASLFKAAGGLGSTIRTTLVLSAACNDPRVKPVSTNWTWPNAVTLGQPSPTLNYNVITTNAITGWKLFIRGDGDNSCHIISGSRNRGTMYPGELAYIHTGVPWRTFWLQPQPSGELTTGGANVNAIPDWAVLDLFSATDTTNIVGRINVNAMITNGVANFPARSMPLNALLTNSLPAPSPYVKSTVTNNLYYGTNLVNNLPSLFPALSPNAMTFIGEVCEIRGLATNNLASSPNKSTNETPARCIANLITTRSNDFTIWAIAQALQVAVTNATAIPITNVTAEVKVQAIVERYQDSTGAVKFRTRYFRYVTQ